MTPTQEKYLAWYGKGLSIVEIGKRFGVTKQAVFNRLRGLPEYRKAKAARAMQAYFFEGGEDAKNE